MIERNSTCSSNYPLRHNGAGAAIPRMGLSLPMNPRLVALPLAESAIADSDKRKVAVAKSNGAAR